MQTDPQRDSSEDPRRTAKVNELRAKYQAGELSVDAPSLAAKLVDTHLSAASGIQAATADSKKP